MFLISCFQISQLIDNASSMQNAHTHIHSHTYVHTFCKHTLSQAISYSVCDETTSAQKTNNPAYKAFKKMHSGSMLKTLKPTILLQSTLAAVTGPDNPYFLHSGSYAIALQWLSVLYAATFQRQTEIVPGTHSLLN